jgi:hypothetical protein
LEEDPDVGAIEPIDSAWNVASHAQSPELRAEPRLLFTVAYSELVVSIADTLFPTSRVRNVGGAQRTISAEDVRPERYVHFRAAWDAVFARETQELLLDLSMGCASAHAGQSFVTLDAAERERFLRRLSVGLLQPWDCLRRAPYPDQDQVALFRGVYNVVIAGMFAEPGYGGNAKGLGWTYANFT